MRPILHKYLEMINTCPFMCCKISVDLDVLASSYPKFNFIDGNSHVSITWACLLVDSRSQRVHSLTHILIGFLIAEAPVPRPSSSSPPRLGPPYLFLFPPTHSCSYFYISFYPGEEVRWRGFIPPLHRPSPRREVDLPSTSSAHPVDYRPE